jgi:hypothetical protein
MLSLKANQVMKGRFTATPMIAHDIVARNRTGAYLMDPNENAYLLISQ